MNSVEGSSGGGISDQEADAAWAAFKDGVADLVRRANASGHVDEQVRGLALPPGNVVDLEAELDGQPALLCPGDRTHVAVEVPSAPIEHVLLIPEVTRLLEVVDVLGEADLVDAANNCRLDESLHRLDRMVDPILVIA